MHGAQGGGVGQGKASPLAGDVEIDGVALSVL